MRKSMKMEIEGYEAVEKTAVKGGNSARIYIPESWEGKKVKAILLK